MFPTDQRTWAYFLKYSVHTSISYSLTPPASTRGTMVLQPWHTGQLVAVITCALQKLRWAGMTKSSDPRKYLLLELWLGCPRPEAPFCPRHDGVQERAMKLHKIEDFIHPAISHQSQPGRSNCSPKHRGVGRPTQRGPRCIMQAPGRAHRKLGRAFQSIAVLFASSSVS